MEGIGGSILNLAAELQTLAVPLAVLAFAVVGAVFIIGTKQMKEGAKGDIYYIIGGVALLVGCVSIGSMVVSNMTF